MTVHGELALRSKLAGDNEDYRVLAASSGLTKTEFEQLYRDLNVGTLPGPSASPNEQPPWILCGGFQSGTRRYLAVIRQSWGETADRSGRSNAVMPALLLPYNEAATQQPSLGTLNDLLRAQEPLEIGDGALSGIETDIPTSGERQRHLAALLDNTIGFEFAAAVAGLLLDGSVALLLGGANASPEERIDYLDAIIALLPYGSRVDLAYSTWMVARTPNKMRLSFSSANRAEQIRVDWRKMPPQAAEVNSLAARYRGLLLGLRDHNSNGTLGLIEMLAAESDPLTLAAPEAIIKRVRELDLAFAVLQEVEAGKGQLNEVRRVFAEDKARVLGEKQAVLLRFWIERLSDEDDIKLIAPQREYISADDVWKPTRERLAGFVKSNDSESYRRLSLLFNLASATGRLLPLLDLLMRTARQQIARATPSGGRPKHTPNSVSAASAVLFVHWLPYLNAEDSAQLLPTFPLGPDLLLAEVMLAALDTNDSAEWMVWLAGRSEEICSWLTPFSVAGGAVAPKYLSPAELRAIEQQGVGLMLALLPRAAARGTLRYFAIGLSEQLLLELPTALRTNILNLFQPFLRQLRELTDLQPEAEAQLDAIALAAQLNEPLFLDARLRGTQTDFVAYSGALLNAIALLLQQPIEQTKPLFDATMRRLIDRLFALPTDPAWTSANARTNTSNFIGNNMDAIRRLLRPDEQHRPIQLRLSTQLGPDATREQVIALLSHALVVRSRENIEATAGLIAERRLAPNVGEFEAVLNDLRVQLERLATLSTDEIRDTDRRLREQALAGTLGVPLRDAYVETLRLRVSYHFGEATQALNLLWGSLDPAAQSAWSRYLEGLARNYHG